MHSTPRRAPVRSREPLYGFTLIELLVVITIIVVLLALLMPAMSRALYRAQLVSCAAQQRTTATGIQGYAFDHKRYYPDRQQPAPQGDGNDVPVTMLAGDTTSGHAALDIRPQLKGYIQINKHLRDPFVEEVDLEFEDDVNTVTAIASYAMWFGGTYRSQTRSLAGMTKLGDSWEFARTANDALRRYTLLLGDVDLTWGGGGPNNISASHPDAAGGQPRLWLLTHNDLLAPTYGIRTFQSFWVWQIEFTGVPASQARRGLMDTNFTHTDGSVQQLNSYEYRDERYDDVAYFFDLRRLPSFRVHIPRR